jgi:hypothetical protein
VRFLILLILIAGFLVICRKDFTIAEATKQEWTGGRQKSARGVNYRITIIAGMSDRKLKLKELWVNRKLTIFRLNNLTSNEPGNSFNKNDTLILTGTVMLDESPGDDNIMENPPFLFNEEIVIGYSLKNKMLYKPVIEIKILKPLYHK